MVRFVESGDADIEFFKEKSKAKNTKKSTNTWVNAYNSWAEAKGYSVKQIFEYSPEELDKILHKFYAEIRKNNGDVYEPSCLNVMHTSLDRYLKENGYPLSIVRDREFAGSKAVLEGVARILRADGKGKRPNRTRSLNVADEEVLWSCGELGSGTPRSLQQTLWWLISQHFGMRGRAEHHDIKMEDFVIQKDENGREYVTFSEGMTKNHAGGLNHKPRMIHPKMFSTGGDRCPVKLLNFF